LSPKAMKVLEEGLKIYHSFYKQLANLDISKWKIDYIDAGWYQIRNALKDKYNFAEFKSAYNVLADKLRPQVYSLGFLRNGFTPKETTND